MSLAPPLLHLPLFWISVPWPPPQEISQRSLGLFLCSKEKRFHKRKTELLSKKTVITWCLDKYCVTVIQAFITLIIHLICSSDSAHFCVIHRFCIRVRARWWVTSFRAGGTREQQPRHSSFCVACKRCQLKRRPIRVTLQVSDLDLPDEPACCLYKNMCWGRTGAGVRLFLGQSWCPGTSSQRRALRDRLRPRNTDTKLQNRNMLFFTLWLWCRLNKWDWNWQYRQAVSTFFFFFNVQS